MGMPKEVPEATDPFYADGYYGANTGDQAGYHDYSLTSANTQAWVSLMVGALRPQGGRILDVGCATGVHLSSIPTDFKLTGIEVNGAVAAAASLHGITILGPDVADPRLANGDWGSFDVITSIATFDHVLNFRVAVTTCLNSLAPGADLVLEVPVISEIRTPGIGMAAPTSTFTTRPSRPLPICSTAWAASTGSDSKIRSRVSVPATWALQPEARKPPHRRIGCSKL
jgi:SAM-dependent methyltransferase